MSTRHLVPPDLLPLLDLLGELHVNADTLEALRSFQPEAPLPTGASRPEVVHAQGRHGAPDVPIRLTRPQRPSPGPRSAILYLHGGGFVLGSAAMSDPMMRRYADDHDAVVAAVDYRLAPETPFPGPLEDGYAALEWLAGTSTVLGIDPARIVVVGDSAGGGLAAAIALLARDSGGPRLAGQVLVFPMIDDRVGGPDDPWRNPAVGEFCWTPASNQFGWTAMRGRSPIPPERIGHFAPARAADLSNLPPTFLGVGSLDLFLDENLDYVRRLAAAGVAVEARVYAGAPHGFRLIEESRAAQDLQADLSRALTLMLAHPDRS